jgi:hypothetical protein
VVHIKAGRTSSRPFLWPFCYLNQPVLLFGSIAETMLDWAARFLLLTACP